MSRLIYFVAIFAVPHSPLIIAGLLARGCCEHGRRCEASTGSGLRDR